ncbi:hypothetical protein IFM51744_10607 [Aspergillus udagawae]|nr:hypothetical protein IFM51744_10607 [Aspergillus udagawae]
MPCPLPFALTATWKPYQASKIKHIITERDDAKRKKLTSQWLQSKVHEVDMVFILSTLLIGVVTASVSWFDMATGQGHKITNSTKAHQQWHLPISGFNLKECPCDL